MFPFWYEFGARTWLSAQHVWLDCAVVTMHLLAGGSARAARDDRHCPACTTPLAWVRAAPAATAYQRCPHCGLLRFHLGVQRGEPSIDEHRVLAFPTPPRRDHLH